jgi:hypothetical protein
VVSFIQAMLPGDLRLPFSFFACRDDVGAERVRKRAGELLWPSLLGLGRASSPDRIASTRSSEVTHETRFDRSLHPFS